MTKSTGLKSVKPGTSSHFSESRDPSYCMLVWPCVQNVPGKNGDISPSGYSLHPQESGQEVVQGPGDVTKSPTLLRPVLVWSQKNYLSRAGLKSMQPMLLHWAPRHDIWIGCSFFPNTPCTCRTLAHVLSSRVKAFYLRSTMVV